MKCPICTDSLGSDAPTLEVFFELERVPVFCNVLHKTPELARSAARGDIRLGSCSGCGMIHNVAFDPALVEYAEGYENSLHCSARFQSFAESLADRLMTKFALDDRDVVEIGAHRGEFLELLCVDGRNRGLGYDPSSPDELQRVEGRPFQLSPEFFDEGCVNGPLGLIYARHVLEHVTQPSAFIRTMLNASERGGGAAAYVEVPNGLWTLRDLGIWDIIYEHCSYFVPSSLRRLFAQQGAAPHVRETFGGQFLSAEVPAGADPTADADQDTQDLDALAGYVAKFTEAFDDRTSYWRSELAASAARGDGFAIWGAGSKGVTFLNILAEFGDSIRGVVDINPLKQGKYVAGTGHEIVGPEQLVAMAVDRVVVMNPLYVEEIGKQLDGLGYRGTVEAIG